MNFYPRYPGDYMSKTAHLSMLEDGAYGRLLDWYYANERPIPEGRVYAVARALTDEERAAVDMVLKEFFVLGDGVYRNDRADDEVGIGQRRIKAAKENGSLGGRPRMAQKPSDNPAGIPGETQRESSPHPYPQSSLRSDEGAKAPSSASVAIACPHTQIHSLYNEVLGASLPRAKSWPSDRAKHATARWREMCKDKGWTTVQDGVAWFKRFFEAVLLDDFLMGRSPRGKGHEGWECTVDYLLSPGGFRRVYEGVGRRQAGGA